MPVSQSGNLMKPCSSTGNGPEPFHQGRRFPGLLFLILIGFGFVPASYRVIAADIRSTRPSVVPEVRTASAAVYVLSGSTGVLLTAVGCSGGATRMRKVGDSSCGGPDITGVGTVGAGLMAGATEDWLGEGCCSVEPMPDHFLNFPRAAPIPAPIALPATVPTVASVPAPMSPPTIAPGGPKKAPAAAPAAPP